MIRVMFQDIVIECSRAVKGANYIRLYNDNNIKIVAFEEVADFSAFSIEGGEWEAGKSTQKVMADAIVSESRDAFVLTIKEKAVVENGLFISFKAPAGSSGIGKIIIDGVEYSFVNAADSDFKYKWPECFAAGDELEIILCVSATQQIARLQNVNKILAQVDQRLTAAERRLNGRMIQNSLGLGTGDEVQLPELVNTGSTLYSFTLGNAEEFGWSDVHYNAVIAPYSEDYYMEDDDGEDQMYSRVVYAHEGPNWTLYASLDTSSGILHIDQCFYDDQPAYLQIITALV